ncbi:MAG: DUF3313 domain-containing protein [Myxococcales bacterium]|nr:DUF3313 domain-containing protein [Myxococcales bacterium]
MSFVTPNPFRFFFRLGLVILLVGALGCGAVRARRSAPEPSGFLGDYSQLAPREDLDALLIYVSDDARWDRYSAIELDSVTLWTTEGTARLTEEEQQMLSDVLYESLAEALGARFQLAERSGPEVLRVRAALTQAKGANVPMRALSTFVPQALLLSAGVGLSLDTAATVGTATVELEVLDSVTDRRLAALVDQRAGTKSMLAGSRTFKTWGDVEAACDFWAERVATGLETQGVRTRPEAP